VSINPDDRLFLLQDFITDRLKQDATLGTYPVITERKADLETELDKALGLLSGASKHGMCSIVDAPMATDSSPECPGGPLDLEVAVLVLENPALNNGTLQALSMCRRIHQLLKHFAVSGVFAPLAPASPCIAPIQTELAPVGYQVRFRTTELGVTMLAKVACPTITNAGGKITLASNTAGASFYYTVDGSYPYAGNSAAVLYTVPFNTPAAGTLIYAAGFKTGSFGSDVMSLTI
jgi:hypothetical protein